MKNGFTLLELVISLAVVSVVMVLAIYGFSSFRESAQIDEARFTILSVLRDARSRTLASEKNTQYGVYFEENKAILFLGDSYNAGLESNEEYILPNLSRISSINLGGSVEVVFSRLSGFASSFGTITIESVFNPSKTKIITILSSGNIE